MYNVLAFIEIILKCSSVQISYQAICFFFFGFILHNYILANLEKLLGVFFTLEVILEFTGEAIALLGVPNFRVLFRGGGRCCSDSELVVHKHRTHRFVYSLESVEF